MQKETDNDKNNEIPEDGERDRVDNEKGPARKNVGRGLGRGGGKGRRDGTGGGLGRGGGGKGGGRRCAPGDKNITISSPAFMILS